ncbi:MAG: AraC family transcriptional regulator ligand-binding domain-containing protein [Polyangiales bacterium]
MKPPLVIGTPCYAARLIQPVVRMLACELLLPSDQLERFALLDADARVSIGAVHELLAIAARSGGEERSWGMRASACIAPGDFGVLDYAISTAATFEAALHTQIRFSRLVIEVIDARQFADGCDTHVRFEPNLALPPLGYELAACTSLLLLRRHWPLLAAEEELALFLPFAPPADPALGRELFGSARLHYNARFCGASFPSRWLSAPMPKCDPGLHAYMSRLASSLLAELPLAQTLTERVRSLLLADLAQGNPSAVQISRRMHMSASTLSRRLADEGTTFSHVLDELRRSVSLTCVTQPVFRLDEALAMTGFANPPAFYRAFKRWTGCTPGQYRAREQELRSTD